MVAASLSPESRIAQGLEELNCAISVFTKMAGVLSRTRLTEALEGRPGKQLHHEHAERLLAFLEELRDLQTDVDRLHNCHMPIDFSRSEEIMTVLTIRRCAKAAAELNISSETLNTAATEATKQIGNVQRRYENHNQPLAQRASKANAPNV